ncbi:iron chelate uptake ABC transporter family permease subunit [Nocardioides aestuarii]|uniref:FecCD family ABC transporter permease n=1 Tax=Nocardioides aestuarii TaxID=252231 RepID=A0ABW4TM53_9ACTN
MTLTAETPATRYPRAAGAGRSRGPLGVVATVVGVLAVATVLSVFVGSRPVPPAALFDPAHPLHAVAAARVPRTLVALAVGAALGLGGACLQGLTRNPLADPGILGINAGASFAMVLAMGTFGISTLSGFLGFAFVGAGVAMVVVHAIAAWGREGATPGRITIAGAAVTAALGSLTTAALLVDRETMEAFRYWQVGTVGGRDLTALGTVLPFLGVGALLAVLSARRLDALALGDDLASGLGARLAWSRAVVGVACALLAGGATALAGPIAFVGLLVPHAARLLAGPSYARVLPLSALLGAALVALADTLGRVVLPPTEVQVGIMTALVGLPAFLWLLRRGRWGTA